MKFYSISHCVRPDLLRRLLWRRHRLHGACQGTQKNGPEDPYEFEVEDEPAKPALSIDAIRHLFRGEVHDFVRNKLLPCGQETLSTLTEPEQTAARFLFCALIGYLKEEAPMDEQSFPMVMEMLNYAEGAKEDGDKDVIDILMEETAARTRQREEYFSDYRRYQLMQVDKERVQLGLPGHHQRPAGKAVPL